MLPMNAVLPLVLLMALLLAASLHVLAASGHFPRERRSSAIQRAGSVILFGSLGLSMISLAIGVTLACRTVPWYAAVIGGGAAVLVAPLALQRFSDRFVDGPGALIAFAGASLATALLLASALSGPA